MLRDGWTCGFADDGANQKAPLTAGKTTDELCCHVCEQQKACEWSGTDQKTEELSNRTRSCCAIRAPSSSSL